METIILASASPRRRELLSRVGVPFEVIPPAVEEDDTVGLAAEQLVLRLARMKVEAAAKLRGAGDLRWVLGLDTLVALGERILAKPTSASEAEAMIGSLSGTVHRVFTGMSLLVGPGRAPDEAIACTEVKFRPLSGAEVRWYAATGEWKGAAGGYRIQQRGAFFVEWIKGSYSNVVGLPLETFYGMLKSNGYSF